MDENKEFLDETENNLSENDMKASDTETVEDINEKFLKIENDIFSSVKPKNKVKEKRQSINMEKLLPIVFSALMLFFVLGISIYCIVSDVKESDLKSVEYTKPDFSLDISGHKREIEMYDDKSGKYTIEGLAAAISPQIVEIYVFEDKNSDTAIGSGSGIIISDDGYIVTNAHVLDGMEKVIVTTHDKKSFEAEIVGKDKKTDIAVIKIEARGLVPAKFGNSDYVIQGESVAAIGNPAGLTSTITEGIVSGLDRKIRMSKTGYEMSCIQTDTAINPGNSGGALVNMHGEVIGIISSKYTTIDSEGLGFAISINEAKPIIEELVKQGFVSGRVKIGIRFYTSYANYMNVMFEEKFGFKLPKELENSLWIDEISKDCDISNTELKPEDFIVEFEGKTVTDYDDLEAVLKGKKGGDKVKAKCARVSEDGKVSYFDIEFKLMADTSGEY